jgi:hypothetical protein
LAISFCKAAGISVAGVRVRQEPEV